MLVRIGRLLCGLDHMQQGYFSQLGDSRFWKLKMEMSQWAQWKIGQNQAVMTRLGPSTTSSV